MEMIENFAMLSFEEQKAFAEELLKTINTEHTFSSETNFEIAGVEADELSGSLIVQVSQTNPINVSRKATWSCDSADDAEDDPGFEADYEEYLFDDAKKSFKTTAMTIADYTVILELSDVDEVGEEAVEVIVDEISNEDAGIGDYEYFGARGTDSRPYCEVSGTIVRSCECTLAFVVEPSDEPVEIDDEEDDYYDGDGFDPDGRRAERPWDSERHFED